MSLPTSKYRELIHTMSDGLPPWKELSYPPYVWLEGQILQESTGDPKAYRKEPSGVASYGLLQILDTTTKNILGNPGITSFDFLYNPYINLSIGRLVLLDIRSWVGLDNVSTILARFNGGGVGNPDGEGKLRNQDYVNKVAGWSQKVSIELGK